MLMFGPCVCVCVCVVVCVYLYVCKCFGVPTDTLPHSSVRVVQFHTLTCTLTLLSLFGCCCRAT